MVCWKPISKAQPRSPRALAVAVEAMAITHRHAPVPGVVTISVGLVSPF